MQIIILINLCFFKCMSEHILKIFRRVQRGEVYCLLKGEKAMDTKHYNQRVLREWLVRIRQSKQWRNLRHEDKARLGREAEIAIKQVKPCYETKDGKAGLERPEIRWAVEKIRDVQALVCSIYGKDTKGRW